MQAGEEKSAADFFVEVPRMVGERKEQAFRLAVETNKRDSPVLVLHRESLVSSSAPS
jgi:hypothetical protein